MEGKVFLSKSLIWAMILLGQIHGYQSCIERERMALFELKKYLISIGEQGLPDSVLPTWTNDTTSDCCGWKGIECNHTSRRVTKIVFGQQYLKEKPLFNLTLLHPFEEVQSLDLSQIGPLCGLFDDIEGPQSLKRLRNLKILDFSMNAFNNSIFPFLYAATSLTTLILRDNEMDGPFPVKELKDLKSLELLDLRGNRFNGTIPVRELSALLKLKALDLSYNQFSGFMALQELKNLTNLEVLGLSGNDFNEILLFEVICEMKNLRELYFRGIFLGGQFPLCLGSLDKLRVLDLSANQLTGNLPSSFSGLESLEYLELSQNNFKGSFSIRPLTNLTKLKVLKLSSMSDMVQVEAESTWQPTFQLSVVELRYCSLEEIPNFLVYQTKLRMVNLSGNRLSGNFPTWLLENNPEVEVLQLQYNSFTIFQLPTIVHKLQVLDISANNISGVFPHNIGHMLPNLAKIDGSKNGFQGDLPSSIGEMKNISVLDLSYNNFSGELPRSFVTGCFTLQFLKLSHNKFSGHFLPRRTNFTSLSVLRIDGNLFTGKIGVGLRTSAKLSVLDMSNNHLTGAIPSWISNFSQLEFFLIANNHMEGAIPPSLLTKPQLFFLDLSGNHLSGALPSHVESIYSRGKKLFLDNNDFTGPIPGTLLENVAMLDLRNNKLSGSIPEFVTSGNLNILLLRGNNLTGSIPRKLCDLSKIRLLDLSHNKLNGFIPSCLFNLSFGLSEGDMDIYNWATSHVENFELEFYTSTFVVEDFRLSYITYMKIEIKFAAKQRYDSYTGVSESSDGTLDFMYGLDLSSNKLSGVILAELGDLSKVRSLNLSHNFLSGSIPDSFSKLKDIESLDLSYNKLQGSIPHQLTSLTFLADFNVSYNNLSGIIPQGRQFSTFKENSYLGNPLLCGSPTDTSCEAINSEEANSEEEDEAAIDMTAFCWSSASTFVSALIGILVLMCFDCPWRRVWFRLVDAFIEAAKSMLP